MIYESKNPAIRLFQRKILKSREMKKQRKKNIAIFKSSICCCKGLHLSQIYYLVRKIYFWDKMQVFFEFSLHQLNDDWFDTSSHHFFDYLEAYR